MELMMTGLTLYRDS